MKQRLFSRTKLIFLGLVVLAFSLRAIYLAQTAEFIQPGTGSDSQFYVQWAEDIVSGNIIGRDVFYALPVYPYFLSLAYLYAGGSVFGLIIIQMLVGSINCGLIYLLGRKLFNEQVGIIAGAIACGYLMFIFYDRMLLPASLVISLGLFLALLLLKVKDNPSLGKWLGAGLLLGLCALAKASFFLLGIFILLWIIYEYSKHSMRQRLLYCACFILSFFLLIGTTTLRNYLVANDPVLITAHSGINFYLGNNPQANGLFKPPPFMRPAQSGLIDDARIIAEKMEGRRLKPSEASNFWLRRSLSFIGAYPLSYLALLAKKVTLFWRAAEHVDDIEYRIFTKVAPLLRSGFLFRFSLISPLALLGLFLSWPKRRKVMLLYIFVFSLSLGTVLFFINSRYRLIVVPYLVILAAYSLWQGFQICKKRQYKALVVSLVLFSALFFLTSIAGSSVQVEHTSSLHYNKAIYLADRKDYLRAEKEFHAAIKLNPRDYMSYFALGNVYYCMQKVPQAIESYNKSLAINPFFYSAHFNLGIIYNEMGQEELAEEEFKEVLNLKSDDCPARYNLGRIYQEKGLYGVALREYYRALKDEKNSANQRQILEAIKEIEELKKDEK